MGTFCTLILWHPTRAFKRSLNLDMREMTLRNALSKHERKWKWAEILYQYKLMRELSKLINMAVGTVVTLFLSGSILSYGLQLDIIFTEFERPNLRRIIMYASTLMTDILVYVLGAQLCQNVGKLLYCLVLKRKIKK